MNFSSWLHYKQLRVTLVVIIASIIVIFNFNKFSTVPGQSNYDFKEVEAGGNTISNHKETFSRDGLSYPWYNYPKLGEPTIVRSTTTSSVPGMFKVSREDEY